MVGREAMTGQAWRNGSEEGGRASSLACIRHCIFEEPRSGIRHMNIINRVDEISICRRRILDALVHSLAPADSAILWIHGLSRSINSLIRSHARSRRGSGVAVRGDHPVPFSSPGELAGKLSASLAHVSVLSVRDGVETSLCVRNSV